MLQRGKQLIPIGSVLIVVVLLTVSRGESDEKQQQQHLTIPQAQAAADVKNQVSQEIRDAARAFQMTLDAIRIAEKSEACIRCQKALRKERSLQAGFFRRAQELKAGRHPGYIIMMEEYEKRTRHVDALIRRYRELIEIEIAKTYSKQEVQFLKEQLGESLYDFEVPEELTQLLIEFVSSEDATHAQDVLVQLGKPAAELLADLYWVDNERVSSRLFETLKRIGMPADEPLLSTARAARNQLIKQHQQLAMNNFWYNRKFQVHGVYYHRIGGETKLHQEFRDLFSFQSSVNRVISQIKRVLRYIYYDEVVRLDGLKAYEIIDEMKSAGCDIYSYGRTRIGRLSKLSIRSGTVSLAHARILAGMGNMEELSFWGDVTLEAGVLDVLGTCTSLKSLKLNHAPLDDDDLRHLSTLTSLEILETYGAGITDTGFSQISCLSKLRELSLNKASIQNVPGLENLTQLKSLFLRGSSIKNEGLEKLSQASGLIELDLSGCRSLQDKDMKVWNGLTQLQRVSLSGTSLGDQMLKSLSESDVCKTIQSFNLSQTSITDGGLRTLPVLPEMYHLELNQTAITDSLLSDLKRHPKLKLLYLKQTAVTDSGLQTLQDAPALTNVMIEETACTPAGEKQLELAIKKRKRKEEYERFRRRPTF